MGNMLRMHGTGEHMDAKNYNFFLNRFCFFTGDADQPRRIHSESEVDTYFRNGRSWPVESGHSTPTGASSPVSKGTVGEVLTPRPGTPDNDTLMGLMAAADTTPRLH